MFDIKSNSEDPSYPRENVLKWTTAEEKDWLDYQTELFKERSKR